MVMMADASINDALVSSFGQASAELTMHIRKAIQYFYANQPADSKNWEAWRTPKPWEERALPNLEQYHDDFQKAVNDYIAGDVEPLTLWAASYVGLSKDLDFDMRWMTDPHRSAVEQAIEQVVVITYEIHRLGYDALVKAGRA